jgi:hypothetical protein
MYYSKLINDFGVIIYLYMDIILIISTNMNDVNDTKKYLTSKFKMKSLNLVNIILGIKVRKTIRVFLFFNLIIL